MSLCLTLFVDATRLLYWPDMVGSLGGGPAAPTSGVHVLRAHASLGCGPDPDDFPVMNTTDISKSDKMSPL